MMTAHAIVAAFRAKHDIDDADFQDWFRDAGYPQSDANIHDSRYLEVLETYVAERDAAV